ncbi:MAG: GDP-mannose 4,6-dehydratase [Erythrobacter sp.]|nr:GDP-mannose 4,6-dehydratase [Erythrobacter sp.]
MTVLVTGAAGFIGSAVAEALCARGERVIGLDNFNAYYTPHLKRDRIARVKNAVGDAFELLEGDFADANALDRLLDDREFDRIVHLGAQPGVRYSLENPRAYVEANVMGHLNLLEIARHRQIAHMVYASSSSVYGGNDKVPFSVEDRVDHPYSLYAATKKADELMSETYAHLYRIPLTALRFFTVYGPWGRPDMMPWLFTDAILSGRPIKVFNEGRMRRDFTFIDDIVSGIIACLDAPPADDGSVKPGGSIGPHALYNIGNNRPEQLMDVIAIIEEACEREAELEMLPMQPCDVPQTYADIDPIRDDLGFQPTVSAAEGFPRFVEWFRRYHALD